jgi:2,4-diaminopentanoate dehydrogenase
VGGIARLFVQVLWATGDRIEPPWTVGLGYVVEVAGDPNVRIKLDRWPDGDLAGMGVEDLREVGMRFTAVPAVNAIPAVCSAEAEICTYAPLQVVTTHMVSSRVRHG